MLALSLTWLTQIHSFNDVVLYVFLSAPAGSSITVVFFTVWGRLYGQAHLGRIQGAAQMLTVIASAIGPALFGFSKYQWGIYGPVLWGLASVTLVLAAVAWWTPLPETGRQPISQRLADGPGSLDHAEAIE